MKRSKKQNAFTLIEIMLVVIILGVLVAMVVPNLAGRGEQARRAAETDIRVHGAHDDAAEAVPRVGRERREILRRLEDRVDPRPVVDPPAPAVDRAGPTAEHLLRALGDPPRLAAEPEATAAEQLADDVLPRADARQGRVQEVVERRRVAHVLHDAAGDLRRSRRGRSSRCAPTCAAATARRGRS